MKISRPRSFPAQVLLASVLLVAGLGGCGRRGAPVPPEPMVPAAALGLRAEAREDAILLTWERPLRNEDGSPLTDLLEFRLFRAIGPAGPREGRGRPSFFPLATVRADQPENAVVQGNQYAFRDDGGGAGLTPGLRYTYRLQAVNRRGMVGTPSAEVFVDYTAAPSPPTGLTAVAGDGVVNLAWQSPPAQADAPSPRGYNVYRGLQRGAYASEPINAGLVLEMRFRDTAVDNETPYYYVVRSVAGDRLPWRESKDSNEVSATPVDLVPPAPPRGLTAIPGPGVVSLSWNANTEPDLLGYLIYRREPPAITPTRLTETPIQVTTFTDRTVRSGRSYIYTATAVDRSSHRNESAPSVGVSVTAP